MDSNEKRLLKCEICDGQYSGIKSFELHMHEKRHQKHVEDKKKQNEVKLLDEDTGFEQVKDSVTQNYVCSMCGAVFPNIIPHTEHLKSKPHSKDLRGKEANDDTAQVENGGNDSELPDTDLNDTLKKVLPRPFISCSICEKQFNSVKSYSQHTKSKNHEKRSLELQLLAKIKAIISTWEVSDSEETGEDEKKEKIATNFEGQKELNCKYCDKGFNGTVAFAQHLTSKNHTKRERRKELVNELKTIMLIELEDDSSLSEGEASPIVLACKVCRASFSGPENMKDHIKGKKHQNVMKLKKHLSKENKCMDNGGRAEISLEDEEDGEKSFAEKETDSSPAENTNEIVKGD